MKERARGMKGRVGGTPDRNRRYNKMDPCPPSTGRQFILCQELSLGAGSANYQAVLTQVYRALAGEVVSKSVLIPCSNQIYC